MIFLGTTRKPISLKGFEQAKKLLQWDLQQFEKKAKVLIQDHTLPKHTHPRIATRSTVCPPKRGQVHLSPNSATSK
jgi:hypothetical protein